MVAKVGCSSAVATAEQVLMSCCHPLDAAAARELAAALTDAPDVMDRLG